MIIDQLEVLQATYEIVVGGLKFAGRICFDQLVCVGIIYYFMHFGIVIVPRHQDGAVSFISWENTDLGMRLQEFRCDGICIYNVFLFRIHIGIIGTAVDVVVYGIGDVTSSSILDGFVGF